jgi:hypothetical protein
METVTLDPLEFTQSPARAELNLDRLGLRVVEAEWGDSEQELFLVRQSLGEIPADRHPPNRTVALKLRAKPESGITLAGALQTLQMKIGRIQNEGGWLRRDFSSGGGFSVSVGAIVHTAVLGGVDGWLMAHRQTLNEITLTLTIGPYFYSVKEIASGEIKVEEARRLEWLIANIKGTAPGLIRIRLKNEAAKDIRGLAAAIESRFYSAAATAALFYECEALTLRGGSSIVGRAGASGGSTVENATLNAGWLNVLDSKIVASGHMTHIGARKIRMRVFDANAALGTVQMRLEWKPQGATRWTQNNVIEAPLIGNWSLVDFGVIRPEIAVVGTQQIEWRISARAPGGAGTLPRLDCVFIEPTEQHLVVTAPDSGSQPDSFVSKLPGTAEDSATVGSTAWTNPANAKLSDGVYATIGIGAGVGGSKESHFLKCTNYGFAIPEGATISGIIVEVKRKGNYGAGKTANTWVFDAAVQIVKEGVAKWESDKGERYIEWPGEVLTKTYGGSGDKWSQTWTPAQINAANFGAAIQCVLQNGTNLPGVTAEIDSVTITVYYTELGDENRLCFQTRSMEVRSDGVFRQHKTEEIWARMIADGFLFVAPPSGMEARSARGLLVPSFGDFNIITDEGNHKLAAQIFYYAGYHFAAESV